LFLNSNPLSPALSPLGRGEGVGGGVKLPRPPASHQIILAFMDGYARKAHSESDGSLFYPTKTSAKRIQL
jgi:hypothetical protein